jgi:Na+:H+ antiporter, NhaA family
LFLKRLAGAFVSGTGQSKDTIKFANYSAVILVAFTILALICANVPALATHYFQTVEYQQRLLPDLGMGVGALSVRDWIKDGLMAIFFFVVGLELMNDFREGELHDPKAAALPIVAALGGMIFPALIYWFVNHTATPFLLGGAPHPGGWPIPVATDIAFAVAALAVLGRGLPKSLRTFLLTLAVVDDLGAVVLIAFVFPFSSSFHIGPLLGGVAVLAAMLLLRRLPAWVYALLALAVWVCAFYAGANTALAAVLAAGMVPAAQNRALGKALQWTSDNLVLPLFALTAAGVTLNFSTLHGLWSYVPVGIVLGLVVGKPLGVLLFSFLATATPWVRLPSGASKFEFAGVACLCGIGFTMSLFLAALSFDASLSPDNALLPQSPQNLARLGIMLGSVLAMLLGWAVLAAARRKKAQTAAPAEG